MEWVTAQYSIDEKMLQDPDVVPEMFEGLVKRNLAYSLAEELVTKGIITKTSSIESGMITYSIRIWVCFSSNELKEWRKKEMITTYLDLRRAMSDYIQQFGSLNGMIDITAMLHRALKEHAEKVPSSKSKEEMNETNECG